MPCTALSSTSSAVLNVSSSGIGSADIASRRWLGMVISVSTAALQLERCPCSACLRRRLPSKMERLGHHADGERAQRLRAMSAMTGAAPVPVPPPMPAVTNTMSAPSSAAAISSLRLQRRLAADLGVGAGAQALGQRLRRAGSCVGAMLCRQRLDVGVGGDEVHAGRGAAAIIVLIALQPPPPTPTTRIFAACLLCSKSSMSLVPQASRT